MRATRAVIDLAQLRANLRAVRRLTAPAAGAAGARARRAPRICLVVKAGAYGHGAAPVARAALQAGVYAFGVATVAEGVELRAAGIGAPILLFSLPLPEEAAAIARAGLTALCGDAALARDLARAASAAGRTVAVHLKIDTGMGRIGCPPAAAPELAQELRRHPALRLTGVCTHFAQADQADREFTRAQLAAFERAVTAIGDHHLLLRHAANSGAIAGFPAAHLDLVRPGIIAYGYAPRAAGPDAGAVRPVMELATRVGYLKRVPAGTGLSYGLTYRAPTATVIGTLPVGYADGYPRALSGRAQVLIRGRRYPVVGRICMDQCLVDLGPRPAVARYDKAVLFGPDQAGPDAAELAAQADTITHEITSRVAARVPRVYRF